MQIFLTHPSRLKPLLREIRSTFPPFLEVWLDEERLSWGDPLTLKIQGAISTESDYVIAFLDERALASPWVVKELEWAMEQERYLERTFLLLALTDPLSSNFPPPEFRDRLYVHLPSAEKISVEHFAARIVERLFQLTLQNTSRHRASFPAPGFRYTSHRTLSTEALPLHQKSSALAQRLGSLLLKGDLDAVTTIFQESIAHEISKYLRRAISELREEDREKIQLTLECMYKSALGSENITTESIRQNCCYYMSLLQTSTARNFLENALDNENSLFVLRGVFLGLILWDDRSSYISQYVDLLNESSAAASINAGYHQCHYGDKFFAEGHHYSENVANDQTMIAIAHHLRSHEYSTIWPIDIFTVRYLVYYNSTSVMSDDVQSAIEEINNTITSQSPTLISELNKLRQLQSSVYSHQPELGRSMEFAIFPEEGYIKRLPSLEDTLDLTEEYRDSVYIDGEFFRFLNLRDHNVFVKRIESHKKKADTLIETITTIPDLQGKTTNILDIGCGFGAFADSWSRHSLGKACGIDVSGQAVSLAKGVFPNVDLRVGHADRIHDYVRQLRPNMVCALDFLEHCFNLELFLFRLANALVPGDLFLCYLPVLDPADLSKAGFLKSRHFYRQHIYFMTRRCAQRFIEDSGFKILFASEPKAGKLLCLFERKDFLNTGDCSFTRTPGKSR